eukprot:scaffold10310_cov109-Isochrysis_galbana.AAC.1
MFHLLHKLAGKRGGVKRVVAQTIAWFDLLPGVRRVLRQTALRSAPHLVDGRAGRGCGADLEPRNGHDVRVHRLRVLGRRPQVGRRAAGADDGERHLVLSAGGRVGVGGRRHLGHGVHAEVDVHELHNRTVAVDRLAHRLAHEVALADDLVGRAENAKRLLGQLRDVVGRSGLEILGVADDGGIAEHLLEDGQVDRVSYLDLAVGRLLLQRCHVRLARLPRLAVDRALSHRGRVGRGVARVVVRAGRIGEGELLGQLGRGRR